MKEKSRLLYIDILNILAIISVISLHCNGIVHYNPNIRAWGTSLIVQVLFYFAVPIFIMISGANLMIYREKYDTKTFFKKRIMKVLIPLIFWSIIMLVWKISTFQITINNFSIKNILNMILSNNIESTYYFLFCILGVYFTMPLLSLLAKKQYRKTLWITCFLFLILNGFLNNILNLFGISIHGGMSIQFSFYIVYVLLGYLLSTERLSKKQKVFLYLLTIIGVIYHYFIRFYFSKTSGVIFAETGGYGSWHAILQACSVFVFIKDFKSIKKLENNKKICKLISEISGCSFGIYLIHLIVKYYTLGLFNYDEYSWKFRILGIIVVYIISLLIIFVIRKIPFIKRIVP